MIALLLIAVLAESPFTHLQVTERIGLWFPRTNTLAAKQCDLHHVAMTIERVPIRGGGPTVGETPWQRLRITEQRWKAMHELFPNSPHFAFVGDSAGIETFAEVYVCPRCREAEEQWLKAHPE